jgi:hypothetical protein
MATTFPTALDNFTNPASTDILGSTTVPHSTQHSNLNDAVEALEVAVGITNSADTASLEYKVANAMHENGIVLGKASGIGIKVDTAAPTYGWRDLIGNVTPKSAGAGSPTLDTISGNIRGYRYSVGDDGDCEFHIPHDYAPGTDLYVHLHWIHNGTNISGGLTVPISHTYAEGHNQAVFPAEKLVNITETGLTIANCPARQHRIAEVQLSSAGGSATLLDSSLIEVDGVILIHYDTTVIPTITGGVGEPFYIFIDIHYQSTGTATKQKAPNFYV